MKKIILLAVLVLIVGSVSVNLVKQKVTKDFGAPVAYPTITDVVKQQAKKIDEKNVKTSLFVPYWTVQDDTPLDPTYDTYLYFGITPSTTGILLNEAGAEKIDAFLATVPSEKKKILVLRMIDSENNSAILNNQKAQQQIIAQSLSLAKKHGFDGVALDLELSAIPFESIIKKINGFTGNFYTEAQKEKLQFSLILYGDVFYRVRPFDVKALANSADMFYIMAYDFHKARGNPGPNFPLSGKEVYGYDMTEMIDDFLQFIPPEKLTVIFGLYGYDWEVDDKGKAISQGSAITYDAVKEKFLGACDFQNCSIKRKNDSFETEVQYTDESGTRHSIWFEDIESTAAKQKMLKEKGISSFSFWANSYF